MKRLRLSPKGVTILLLLGIIVVGAALRVYRLDHKLFQEDEASTLQIILSQSPRQILLNRPEPTNPPLYFFLVKIFSIFFGTSEFALKFPSVLFGVLSLGIAYKIGALLASRSLGLMAALLCAVNPDLVLYSQFARSYSLLTLLGLCSAYCLWAFLILGKPRYFWGMLFFNVLGVMTHFSFLFLIGIDSLFLLWRRRDFGKRPLIGWFGFCLVVTLFLIPTLSTLWNFFGWISHSSRASPITQPYFVRPLFAFFSFCLGESVYPFTWPIVLPAACLFSITFLLGVRASALVKDKVLLLLRVGIPLVVWFLTGSVTTRYVVHAVPFFLILVVYGMRALPFLRRAGGSLILVSLVALQTVSLSNWYRGNSEQILNSNLLIPWKEIGHDINERRQREDWIILYPEVHSSLFRYYYPAELPNYVSLPEDRFRQPLEEILYRRPSRIWWVDMPRAIPRGERIELQCYRSFYEKGYLLNPRLGKHLATGKKTYDYAVTLRGYESVKGCDRPLVSSTGGGDAEPKGGVSR